MSQLSVSTSTFATPILTPTTSVAPAQSLRRSNSPSLGSVEAHFEAAPSVQRRKKLTPKAPMPKPSQGRQPSPGPPAQAAESEANRSIAESLSYSFLRRQMNRDWEHFNALRNQFLEEFKYVVDPEKCVLYACSNPVHEAKIVAELKRRQDWFNSIKQQQWTSGTRLSKFDTDCENARCSIRNPRGQNKYHLPSCTRDEKMNSWGCSEPLGPFVKAVNDFVGRQ